MAKNLPYFKFTVADWLTGDIVYEPLNVQGLFINICAIYWQRNGILMIEDINRRFRNPAELSELIDRFFTVKDGFISISFLDEQFDDRKTLSKQNSKNAQKRYAENPNEIKENDATACDRNATACNKEKRREEKRRKDIGERAKDFYNSIAPHTSVYGKEMCREFYDYWTEPNPSKTKLKFETQRTWDLSKRLKRWFNNIPEFKRPNKQSYSTIPNALV